MSTLRPVSVCDTTPLQRFESQSSSGEEPSSPTASSILAAASGPNHNNNNNVKLDLQLPNFVGSSRSQGPLYAVPSNKKPTLRGPRQIFGRILMDLCLLSCVGLPMLGFSLWGEAVKRGFFCNDSSLKHPYRDSTMPSWILYSMCGVLPLSVMLVVEFFRGQDKRLHSPFPKSTTCSGYHLCHLELPTWLVECYHRMGIFIFGLGVEQLSTNIAKYSIGRLRPHFYTLCQPVMNDGTTCSDPINAARYIEEFTCAAVDITSKQLKDMRLSFPSGHASFACYSMLYLVIYLHRRMHWKQLRMLCHLLQFLLLMFAWYTALTRVSDYKHHWSDVLAGSGIGLTYAVVVTSTMW
ncbi:putative phosphatidate phosphatase [Drosophila mauritiana]|uniref:Phosphatidate phosphatase n=1 Tax=Drosophila mauritiana TaxID=7226 RepID=A0A6P8JF96_DROMA|nr:putative phosphatidate phosphatase [Drosophila mauritiana]